MNLQSAGLSLDILKMESWTYMGRTANIIIKVVIHVFASISKILRILLMGRRNRECWSAKSVTELSKNYINKVFYFFIYKQSWFVFNSLWPYVSEAILPHRSSWSPFGSGNGLVLDSSHSTMPLPRAMLAYFTRRADELNHVWGWGWGGETVRTVKQSR